MNLPGGQALLASRRGVGLPPPPKWWEDLLWEWDAILMPSVWLPCLAVAVWLGVLMRFKGRGQLLGVLITVPVLIYASSGVFGMPRSTGWAFWFNSYDMRYSGVAAVHATVFLGAAYTLCRLIRRSPDALSRHAGRCLGAMAVPASIQWLVAVIVRQGLPPSSASVFIVPAVCLLYPMPWVSQMLWLRKTRFNLGPVADPPAKSFQKPIRERSRALYIWTHLSFGATAFAALIVLPVWCLALTQTASSLQVLESCICMLMVLWLATAIWVCLRASRELIVATR